jgi:hypothetical protein
LVFGSTPTEVSVFGGELLTVPDRAQSMRVLL